MASIRMKKQIDESQGPNLVIMLTSPGSWRLIGRFPSRLERSGWRVALCSSPGLELEEFARTECVVPVAVAMRRDPAPLHDLRALIRILFYLFRARPEVLLAGTPKAGLIGMLAGALARVRRRVYWLHGLRAETETGVKRLVLLGLERAALLCATEVVAVSASLKNRVVELGLAPASKITVLGLGSANGVDVKTFHPEARKAALSLPQGPTVGFVGRLHIDKGVDVLAAALTELAAFGMTGNLLVVGGDDAPESQQLRKSLDRTGWHVQHVGMVDDVAGYLRLMDVLCLPTRREGFGNVLIEAGACGVPVVATRVTGVVDAVADGVTGLLVPSGDVDALAAGLRALLEDAALRSKMGAAGLDRVESHFTRESVQDLWEDFLGMPR